VLGLARRAALASRRTQERAGELIAALQAEAQQGAKELRAAKARVEAAEARAASAERRADAAEAQVQELEQWLRRIDDLVMAEFAYFEGPGSPELSMGPAEIEALLPRQGAPHAPGEPPDASRSAVPGEAARAGGAAQEAPEPGGRAALSGVGSALVRLRRTLSPPGS
jgi:hypothetical protein